MKNKNRILITLIFISGFVSLLSNSCSKEDNTGNPTVNHVYTTVERTIIPGNVSAWPVLFPFQISKYPDFPEYGSWSYGPGLAYQKRLDLMAPEYSDNLVSKSAGLLYFLCNYRRPFDR